MKVKGHRLKIKQPAESYVPVWRVYGTKKVERGADGRVRPKPETWEPLFDLKCEARGGELVIPDFELEYTRPGGWRFYRMIAVDGAGREDWDEEDEDTALVFTPAMVEEFAGDVDWATLLLYNLELKGIIKSSDWCKV